MHKRLCVQFTVSSTQPSSSLGFCLQSICTTSPQQTQQAWNLIPAGTSLSHTCTHTPLSTTASSFQFQASSPVSPAVHLCLSTTPVIPGCLSGAVNPHRGFCRCLPPFASPTLPPSHSQSLSVSLSSSTCGGNSLFNSLQHQPINSFADWWLAPAGAG